MKFRFIYFITSLGTGRPNKPALKHRWIQKEIKKSPLGAFSQLSYVLIF